MSIFKNEKERQAMARLLLANAGINPNKINNMKKPAKKEAAKKRNIFDNMKKNQQKETRYPAGDRTRIEGFFDDKQTKAIEKAAELAGLSRKAFVELAANERASRVINSQTSLKLKTSKAPVKKGTAKKAAKKK